MTKRILFLHGMFCPPSLYVENNGRKLFETLRKSGFEVVTDLKSPRRHTAQVPSFIFDLFPEFKGREDEMPEWYNAFTNDDGTKRLEGLEQTLNFLQNYLATQDRFDVIMGHSQGAQLVSILTLLMETKNIAVPEDKQWELIVPMNAPNPFDTVVNCNVANFCRQHGKLQTKSIHVTGGPKDLTYQGSKHMMRVNFSEDNVMEVAHNEGHFLPQDETVCASIAKAIHDALESD
jgi:hypothetical protein